MMVYDMTKSLLTFLLELSTKQEQIQEQEQPGNSKPAFRFLNPNGRKFSFAEVGEDLENGEGSRRGASTRPRRFEFDVKYGDVSSLVQ